MAIDWTEICQKYRGLWVGLKEDEKTVVASGKTIEEVMRRAKEEKYPKPILFRVPNGEYLGLDISSGSKEAFAR